MVWRRVAQAQGSAGTFDLSLDASGVAANATVESRDFTSGDQLVLTFSKTIKGAGTGGAATPGQFVVNNAVISAASISGNVLTLTLSAMTDQSVVSIALIGITDASGNALAGPDTLYLRALAGDVNQNQSVSIGDLQAMKNQIGQTVNSSNFLDDVNCDGIISVGDLQDVKNRFLDVVP